MRILICGDRHWPHELLHAIQNRLQDANRGIGPNLVECVIEGECSGADLLGRAAATALRIPVIAFPADWKKYGRAAGPIRNQQMLDEGKPTHVWAFHNDIEHSRGTADMVRRARKANIPVTVFTEQV